MVTVLFASHGDSLSYSLIQSLIHSLIFSLLQPRSLILVCADVMSRRAVTLTSLLLALLLSQRLTPSFGSAVLISDMTMTMMVELSSRHPFCKMHTDR